MAGDYPPVLTELWKAGLAIFGLVLVVVLLGLGPVGWVILLCAVIVGGTIWRSGDSEGERLERVNCPNCGAPNTADDTACSYCEQPL